MPTLRRVLAALFPVVALLPAVLLLACPGGSSGSGGAAASSDPPRPALSASTVAAASTSATINATLDPPASAAASATASASASAKVAAAASSSGKSATAPTPTCGDKPLPACPLKKWMQANSGPAMSAKDFASLVTIFNRIVTMAPPGYGNWGSIAKNGAQAAQSEDGDGCKAACRQCHDQYKAKFKADYAARSRPI